MKLTGYNEPLGLPRGTVRAVASLLCVLPVPAVVVLGCLGNAIPSEIMAFYSVIVLLVLRDYFGTRQTQDAAAPKEDVSTVACNES